MKDYKISKIDSTLAANIIKEHHYSHSWSSCKHAIGLFSQEFLVGIAVYGFPVGRQVTTSISPLINKDNVLELKRLWISDSEGKNTESWFLSRTFHWLRKYDPIIKVLISYSDPDHGHLGVIYQATNWLYQGVDIRQQDAYFYYINGEQLHPRTVYSKYGSTHPSDLIKIDPNFKRVLMPKKHRYLYILAPKKEKRRILRTLKHPILSYPKSNKCEVRKMNGLVINQRGDEFFE